MEDCKFKHIIRTVYLLRVRKGQIEVALEPDNDNRLAFPTHIIKKGEPTYHGTLYKTEDKDDLILFSYVTEDPKSGIHKPKKSVWKRAMDSFDEEMPDNELAKCIVMFQIILDNYEKITGCSDEHDLMNYYEKFKTIMLEKARREYISEIKAYINGYKPMICDAIFVPMDNELLKKELETMAHFAPKASTEYVAVNSGRTMKMSEFKYDYYIEYEDFGGGIELIDIWQPRDDLDFLDELSLEELPDD